jgi:hypothetical protein
MTEWNKTERKWLFLLFVLHIEMGVLWVIALCLPSTLPSWFFTHQMISPSYILLCLYFIVYLLIGAFFTGTLVVDYIIWKKGLSAVFKKKEVKT